MCCLAIARYLTIFPSLFSNYLPLYMQFHFFLSHLLQHIILSDTYIPLYRSITYFLMLIISLSRSTTYFLMLIISLYRSITYFLMLIISLYRSTTYYLLLSQYQILSCTSLSFHCRICYVCTIKYPSLKGLDYSI